MLKIEHVSKVYRIGNQDFTALHDVNLEIPAGAFMSFVGPSGSGKTTLLNLLGGLDKPTEGHVVFRDYRLDELSREKLAEIRRQHIGFIFQSYNLLPVYTVYENILFPLLLNNEKESKVRDRVREVIRQVGLEPETNKKPSELSGGQCQRVAIARALIKKPDIVLADEPTANLDKENSLMILELMQQLNRDYKAAFIFSTHDEKVNRFVNREVLLEDGYVISDKTVESAPA